MEKILVKMLALTSVYFLESRLFNELKPIPAKKFSSATSSLKFHNRALSVSPGAAVGESSIRATGKAIEQPSVFRKSIVVESAFQVRALSCASESFRHGRS
jgi:hypothetical protein